MILFHPSYRIINKLINISLIVFNIIFQMNVGIFKNTTFVYLSRKYKFYAIIDTLSLLIYFSVFL